MNHDSPDMDQFLDDVASRYERARSILEGMKPEELSKPDRETVINGDDITNLKIALGSANSLESFLEMV